MTADAAPEMPEGGAPESRTREKAPRGRPRRTDPSGPGRDEIVAAVVRIAERGGYGDISMRDVAEALNVSPKLLYRHVSGKAELLELAAASILAQWDFPAADVPWPERLTRIIRDTQLLLRRYPALAEPALLRNLKSEDSPETAKVVAAIKDSLLEAGLSPAEADRIFLLYVVLVLGEITLHKAILGGTLPPTSFPGVEAIDTGLDTALHWLIAGIRASRATKHRNGRHP
jgi:AcrR family transcriptional regulator